MSRQQTGSNGVIGSPGITSALPIIRNHETRPTGGAWRQNEASIYELGCTPSDNEKAIAEKESTGAEHKGPAFYQQAWSRLLRKVAAVSARQSICEGKSYFNPVTTCASDSTRTQSYAYAFPSLER